MRPAAGILLALTLVACGGRQEASRRPTTPAARATAAPPARTAPPVATEAPQVAAAETPADVGSPAAPSTGAQVFVPTATDQVFVRRMLDVIDEVATVMEKQQDACDRMASDLEGVMHRNHDLILMAKQMQGSPARDKWMQEQATPRLNQALPRMMAGFQKCQNDARLKAVFQQLGA